MSSWRGTSRVVATLLGLLVLAQAQKTTPGVTQKNWTVRPEWVRAHEEFLASDALEGRGSGTRDEWITATYIGSELRAFGVEPAGDDGSYVQRVELEQEVLTAPPALKAGTNPETIFEFGKDFRVFRLSGKSFSGPLQKVDLEKPGPPPEITKGAIVLATLPSEASARRAAFRQVLQFIRSGAAALLIPEAAQTSTQSSEVPKLVPRIKGIPPGEEIEINVLTLTADVAGKIAALQNGSSVNFITTTKLAEP